MISGRGSKHQVTYYKQKSINENDKRNWKTINVSYNDNTLPQRRSGAAPPTSIERRQNSRSRNQSSRVSGRHSRHRQQQQQQRASRRDADSKESEDGDASGSGADQAHRRHKRQRQSPVGSESSSWKQFMANTQQGAGGTLQSMQAAADQHHLSLEKLGSLCYGKHADGAFDVGPKFKPHALGR